MLCIMLVTPMLVTRIFAYDVTGAKIKSYSWGASSEQIRKQLRENGQRKISKLERVGRLSHFVLFDEIGGMEAEKIYRFVDNKLAGVMCMFTEKPPPATSIISSMKRHSIMKESFDGIKTLLKFKYGKPAQTKTYSNGYSSTWQSRTSPKQIDDSKITHVYRMADHTGSEGHYIEYSSAVLGPVYTTLEKVASRDKRNRKAMKIMDKL